MAVTTPKNTDGNGSGFTRKNLEPGNHLCTIHSITMQKAEHIKDKEEWQIVLNLEGPPIGGTFQGFFFDYADQSKGFYAGQSSKVKLSEYNYRDGETKAHHPILRDEEILKDLKRLCEELGDTCTAWYDKIDERNFETVELVISAFNTEHPFAGIQMNYCIAGKKYMNKKGYPAYELFLPRKSDLGRPYCKDAAKVQKYLPSVHIKEAKVKELSKGFEKDEPNITDATILSETKTNANEKTNDKEELPFSLT